VGGIGPFLQAIPVAAKSPYALIAYTISGLLFIASLNQRNQLKRVLKKINEFPKDDRKGVIETTLNTKLPATLSGEQYLRREKTKYLFLGFIALLVLVGGITAIALVIKTTPPPAKEQLAKNTKVRVQLWPRPEIKRRFLKEHDARLYVKCDSTQLDLTTFVPSADFLDTTIDVEDGLIGRPVNLTITPREKYTIQEDRRFLTPVVRLEVYPIGKKPVPVITSTVSPSGEKVFRTTDLPLSAGVTTLKVQGRPHTEDPGSTPQFPEIIPNKPYLLDITGEQLSAGTKISIVDDKGRLARGAWAGNEIGSVNGKPVEVTMDGTSLRVYCAAPPSVAGQTLFWRIENSSSAVALFPLEVKPLDGQPEPRVLVRDHWWNSIITRVTPTKP